MKPKKTEFRPRYQPSKTQMARGKLITDAKNLGMQQHEVRKLTLQRLRDAIVTRELLIDRATSLGVARKEVIRLSNEKIKELIARRKH